MPNEPLRHGIFMAMPAGRAPSPDEWPSFRFGFMEVANAMCDASPSLANVDVAAKVRQHLLEVERRFIFSLQQLNARMAQMAEHVDEGELLHAWLHHQVLEAGCYADSALSYLGMMADDIAQLAMLSLGVLPTSVLESMGQLYGKRANQDFAVIVDLLNELQDAQSWWSLGFARQKGARQLVVHNHHVVQFSWSAPPGGMTHSNATLVGRDGTNPIALIDELRQICASWCSWLDRMEQRLLSHLGTTHAWPTDGRCHTVPLGVGWSTDGVTIHDRYFPLPLCAGADRLPWTVEVEHVPTGARVGARSGEP